MRAILAVIALAVVLLARPGASQDETVRLLVGFRQEAAVDDRAKVLKRLGMDAVADLDPLNVIVVETTRQRYSLNGFQLLAHPHVALVEEDFYENWIQGGPASFAQTDFPVDRIADIQPKFKPKKVPATRQEVPWGVAAVRANAAWRSHDPRSQGGGVKVAVLDTGVDCSHPDLHCTYGDGIDVTVEHKADPVDENGHGTHVAGTIAAQHNAIGVVGVAPQARIVPVKVLNKDGGGYVSRVIQGIIWCANQEPPIPVANVSLATARNSLFLRSAVSFAKMRGVTIVAAAGNNDLKDPTAPFYPAAYPEVISVAAMDVDNTLWPNTSRGSKVFVAPGVNILSTLPGGEYGRDFGSSMAAPHISGLAAIAVAYGAQNMDDVKLRLASASRPIRGDLKEQGFGLPDAVKLIGR